MNFGYFGYKLLMAIGILFFIEGFVFYNLEDTWQTLYTDKNNMVHYKGKMYGIEEPLKFNHRIVSGSVFDKVQVKDYRYISWVNWTKRFVIYRIVFITRGVK